MRRTAAAPRLEYREVFQQRDDAQHDDHHAHDPLGAAVHRQHVDQIKDEDDDDEGDQSADENVHGILRVKCTARKTPAARATIVSTLDGSSHDGAPGTRHPDAPAITPRLPLRFRHRPPAAIFTRRVSPYTCGIEESTMPEPASLIMLQFLAWVADRQRTYAATMEAWHSTCPRLSVWEDAIIDGLVRIDNEAGRPVRLTPRGSAILEESRAHAI